MPARRLVRLGSGCVDAIPPDREILALHEKYAPSPEALDSVYTHCGILAQIAEQLLHRASAAFPGEGVSAALGRAGSLLHDIGVYRLYDEAGHLDHPRYIQHGVLGH